MAASNKFMNTKHVERRLAKKTMEKMQSDLELKKKRLIMRAEHRGIKEMDIIMGGFVRNNLDRFNCEKMNQIEDFMSINDQSLYQMILGNEEIPAEFVGLVAEIRADVGIENN